MYKRDLLPNDDRPNQKMCVACPLLPALMAHHCTLIHWNCEPPRHHVMRDPSKHPENLLDELRIKLRSAGPARARDPEPDLAWTAPGGAGAPRLDQAWNRISGKPPGVPKRSFSKAKTIKNGHFGVPAGSWPFRASRPVFHDAQGAFHFAFDRAAQLYLPKGDVNKIL